MFNDPASCKNFKVLTIKNIRIEEEPESISKSRVSRTTSKEKAREKKTVDLLLVFYDLFEGRKLRKRLLELSLQATYHTDNRLLANTWFYLPKTDRKILV